MIIHSNSTTKKETATTNNCFLSTSPNDLCLKFPQLGPAQTAFTRLRCYSCDIHSIWLNKQVISDKLWPAWLQTRSFQSTERSLWCGKPPLYEQSSNHCNAAHAPFVAACLTLHGKDKNFSGKYPLAAITSLCSLVIHAKQMRLIPCIKLNMSWK